MFWALHWQKNMYRQRWSNAHVIAELGRFNGYVCHFPFTLSFIFRPDAPRIWPYPLPEQHTILIPCGCKVWTEEHRTSSTSPSSCSSRLISSSGTAEHLRILSCTRSTSIGTALHCWKCSVFQRSGVLTISQVICEWPIKCLSSFWGCGSKVLMAGTYWRKKMPLLLLYSAFLMCRDVSLSRKFWNRIQVSPGLLSLNSLQKSSGSCSFVCTSYCTHNLSPIYIKCRNTSECAQSFASSLIQTALQLLFLFT